MPQTTETVNAEKLMPAVRARLAVKLGREGLRVREIASALNITPAAVVQYMQGKRGKFSVRGSHTERTIDALAEKVLQRIRSGVGGGVRTTELVEAAEQLVIASRGNTVLEETTKAQNTGVLDILRQRLQLELKASERCLESAVKFEDQYAKLLLRMIAADSLRHADVVSQIISWIEVADEQVVNLPRKEFLNAILQIEDKAGEILLRNAVKISHPVARLLLEWIDADEQKHERIIGKMARLVRQAPVQ